MVRKHAGRLILASCLAFSFVACTDAKEQKPLEDVQIVGDPDGDCANAGTVALGKRFRGSATSGDVDGDGTEDRVWVAIDEKAPLACSGFLTVATGDKVFWVSLNENGDPRSLQTPTIDSLAPINAEPGAEVVVNLESGASTQFVGLFALTDAGLEAIEVEGRGPGPFSSDLGSLLPFGGSVGHLDGVDCAGAGVVVMTSAVPRGDTADSYKVERRYFEATGSSLVLDKDRTEHETVTSRDLDELTELTTAPFGSCN